MSDHTSKFDLLIQRYEMGVAYRAITATMGPSPQLVAFINYDNVTDQSVGLESFNIMALHDAILAEIESDRSLDLAVESLETTLNKVGQKLQTGGWAAFWGSVVSLFFIGGRAGNIVAKIGGIGVIAALAGRIVVATTDAAPSEPKFITYNSFTRVSEKFTEAYKLDLMLMSSFPKTFEAEAWKKYRDVTLGGPIKQFFHGSATDELTAFVAEAPARTAGWTPEHFQNGVKWLKHNVEALDKIKDDYAKDLEKVKAWLKTSDKTDKNNIQVMKYISETLGVTVEAFQHSAQNLNYCKQILDNAGKQFKEVK